MRLRRPWSLWTLAGCLALWLALGAGAWAIFVDARAPEARLLLAACLAGSAVVLWIASAIRRAALLRRIESVDIAAPDIRDGRPARVVVTIRARRAVTVSRVVATLSVIAPTREAGELPNVVHREERVLAERLRLEPKGAAEFSGEFALPAGLAADARAQVDALVFVGSRVARRATSSPRRTRG